MPIYRVTYRRRVWSYLLKFAWLMFLRLWEKNKKYGDEWKKRSQSGQAERIYKIFLSYYRAHTEKGEKINWLDIAGLALIGWIRDYELERLNKKCMKQ